MIAEELTNSTSRRVKTEEVVQWRNRALRMVLDNEPHASTFDSGGYPKKPCNFEVLMVFPLNPGECVN